MQLWLAKSVAYCGVPVGREIPEHTVRDNDVGSIIVVVATDAPLIPTQLKRAVRRVSLGLGRDGSFSGDGSGDIFIALSTANPGAASSKGIRQLTMLPNESLNPLFLAIVQATEEAVINAMVAAETMKGIIDFEVIAFGPLCPSHHFLFLPGRSQSLDSQR
jgi:D-aminopeptidase